jgi:DedD protein
MNTRYAQDEELDDAESQESELTLGTPVLIGIFFGIVLLCGIFFGIGYSMGRRSGEAKAVAAVQNTAQRTSTENTADNAGSSTLPKPSALQQMPAQGPAESSPAPMTSQEESTTVGTQPATAETPVRPQQVVQDSTPSLTPVPVAAKPVKAVNVAPRPVSTTPTSSATGGMMVQVAAVSHQADAEALVAALRRKGYNAAIRTESQDKLLHVQVGPMASHVDAYSVRQKLLAEGYNAIIK